MVGQQMSSICEQTEIILTCWYIFTSYNTDLCRLVTREIHAPLPVLPTLYALSAPREHPFTRDVFRNLD